MEVYLDLMNRSVKYSAQYFLQVNIEKVEWMVIDFREDNSSNLVQSWMVNLYGKTTVLTMITLRLIAYVN